MFIVASLDDSFDPGDILFQGTVNLNGTFQIDAATLGEDTFKSNTYFRVFSSQGGTLLQEIQIHTSCSAPLFVGDSFGSLLLTDFVGSQQ